VLQRGVGIRERAQSGRGKQQTLMPLICPLLRINGGWQETNLELAHIGVGSEALVKGEKGGSGIGGKAAEMGISSIPAGKKQPERPLSGENDPSRFW